MLDFFIVYVYLIAILPISIGIIKFKKLNLTCSYILLLVCVSFSSDMLLRVLIWNGVIGELYTIIGYTYTLIEFSIISLIFYFEFKGFLSKKILFTFFALFLTFTVIDILFLRGLSAYNSYQRFVEGIFVIIYVLIYFYKLAKELKVAHLERESLFWFSTGLLLYFSGSTFIFIFSNYLLAYSDELFTVIWAIHASFLILFQILNALAIWISPKKLNLLTY